MSGNYPCFLMSSSWNASYWDASWLKLPLTSMTWTGAMGANLFFLISQSSCNSCKSEKYRSNEHMISRNFRLQLFLYSTFQILQGNGRFFMSISIFHSFISHFGVCSQINDLVHFEIKLRTGYEIVEPFWQNQIFCFIHFSRIVQIFHEAISCTENQKKCCKKIFFLSI